MKTILIETERRSYTVQDRIDAGDVELFDCVHLDEVEKVVWQVHVGKLKCDILVIDTLTTLKTQTMLDIAGAKAGSQANGLNLMANREKFKATQPEWGIMSDIMTRLVLFLRDMPITTILVCHEGTREVEDGLYERRAPNLNPALISPVLDNSDLIVRLGILGRETEIEKKKWPPGTRVARLIEDERHVAKVATPSIKIKAPPLVAEPTLGSLLTAIGGKKLPGMITIYGSQGAGKTNLACTGYTLDSHTATATTKG